MGSAGREAAPLRRDDFWHKVHSQRHEISTLSLKGDRWTTCLPKHEAFPLQIKLLHKRKSDTVTQPYGWWLPPPTKPVTPQIRQSYIRGHAYIPSQSTGVLWVSTASVTASHGSQQKNVALPFKLTRVLVSTLDLRISRLKIIKVDNQEKVP